ncbi:MAG: hypothetical protein AB4040_13930 [Synechococcus sp.]
MAEIISILDGTRDRDASEFAIHKLPDVKLSPDRLRIDSPKAG